MRIPTITGIIRRRVLVNFRIKPDVMQRLLPAPFRPKLQAGYAIAGICLIRLEEMRPAFLPAITGFSSENAAHRVAVEWDDPASGEVREGVYIPRRDTGSCFNYWAGGHVFPGEHEHARFTVKDTGSHIDFAMRSDDGRVHVEIAGDEAEALPAGSCFGALDTCSRFFEGGCSGYSATRAGTRLDGLCLRVKDWQVKPLAVERVRSSWFEDPALFPPGAARFDNALIMRNIVHKWETLPGLELGCAAAAVA